MKCVSLSTPPDEAVVPHPCARAAEKQNVAVSIKYLVIVNPLAEK
jgi:hypothetical protein